ncbi:uncharacterized protein TRIADDRAFT_21627 [Trichoplax adhaerens]|uniref:ABC-type xenobiotic transporter n=1 Tax=Trichoplax adhaerens TaxID=10228 RepID=B3RPF6_TRIAD|nr:hypothetical protein TRIADDRAFT_21627 [Trichoplax adhaerens]EDV28182.1 hypothetical protein TRIADDRAFT_21627 [Trichoplax adhaerens]|eukprot:XP_002110016.1 hypothetical protein TRIADDRAFT_21627 [Trichoplax adhaerens]
MSRLRYGINVDDEDDEEQRLLTTTIQPAYSTIDTIKSEEVSPLGIAEDNNSDLSRLFFCWVQPMMVRGAAGKLRQAKDLFLLPRKLKTSYIRRQFMRAWTYKHTNDETDDNVKIRISLLTALNRTFGKTYYPLAILKLSSDLLGFTGPLLLHQLVTFVENKNQPTINGYIYAAGLFFATGISAILNTQFTFKVNKVGIQIRTALVAVVYSKALSVNTASLSKFDTGEIVNLMSTDTDRIVNFCPSFHQFWSLPFQIAISLYLLYQQVGISFLAGVAFIILLIPINKWLAGKIGQLSTEMMKQKDGRVNTMSEILYGIRVIKFYAWEANFANKIERLRNAELKSLKGRKYLDALCVYFWATTPVIISILTFATYAALGNRLTAAKVFTSVALFNMLISPLNAFPWVLNGLMEAWVSVKRVQKFLSVEEFDSEKYYSIIQRNRSEHEIEINSGTFTWQPSYNDHTESERPSIVDIAISASPGQLVGIVGKVGSGKSSLLGAMTGELRKITGQISIPQRQSGFGIFTQEPWIQQGTIKENILFGKAYNESAYKATIFACALEEDLRILPAGDCTEIGENGVTLSGGQKARLTLARAVYQDKEIYLLDDPLAAVDSHVAQHLFQHCILGILKHKTRILCTHQTQFLRQADVVTVLDAGRIIQSGPPESVLDSETSVSTITLQKFESIDINDNDDTLITQEEQYEGVVALSVYKAYWSAVGICLSIIIFTSLLLMQGSRNVSDWWLSFWISQTKNHSPHYNSINSENLLALNTYDSNVTFYLTIYSAIAIGNTMFTLLRAFSYAYGGICAAKILHNQLFDSVLRAPVQFFDTTPVGRIINRFSSDAYAIDDSLPFIMNILLAQLYGFAGTIVITCIGLPWFMIALIPVGIIYYFIQRYYRKTSREIKRLSTVTLSPIYTHFTETLNGLQCIRAFRASEAFSLENERRLETYQRANYASQAVSQWLGIRLQLLGVGMVTAVGFIAVIQHHFQTVDPGLIGLAISYALSVTSQLSGVLTAFTETEKEMISVERAKQYIDGIHHEEVQQDYICQVPSLWPSKGTLQFNNVTLIYRQGLPPALNKVSFTTRPSEKIGIVGRTGSGKSSLFLALFRMQPLASGNITLDDIDICTIPTTALRSRMAIIPQDPFLFNGTIRNNVDPFNNHSDSELLMVLEKCHLNNVIDRDGLETDVGNKGRNLSVGERQLVCLARALLTNAQILCIDEATASVDHNTDKLIQETIKRQFQQRTVLTIAHRVSSILDSDRILVMDNGRVIEFEKPDKLLSDGQSSFYKLVERSKSSGYDI